MSSSPPTPAARRPRGRPNCKEFAGAQALLKHARSAFARHGFEATSLRSIAEASGVDAGLVAHHFGSKDALWNAVVDDIVRLVQPLITELQTVRDETSMTPRARLNKAVALIIAQNFRHPDMGMFFSTASTAQGERLTNLIERLVRPYHEALAGLVRDAIASGEVAAQDPEILCSMLSSAISKTVSYRHVLAHFSPIPDDPARFEQSILRTALAMLD